MVVITLIAIATAGVTFAFRDNQSTLLDREADRLSTILETVRVQSRSSGVAIASISPWLAPGMNAQIVSQGANAPVQSLLLGAEPMIAPASVVLRLGERRLRVATDGLRPFAVQVVDDLVGKP
jgi:general secretion pathway protein H